MTKIQHSMSLPPKKKRRSRNRRFPLPKIMTLIRIMMRLIWMLSLNQRLLEKTIGRDQDGSVTLYKMHQVTPLLEVLSGKVKDPRDILGTPP